MKKKVSISILIIAGILLVVGSLYGTFAYNSIVTSNNDSYTVTLSGNSEKVTVPASGSKTVVYKVTNTNKGVVQYGLAYQGSNINVYYYEDTEDMPSGLIDYGQNKFIKLYIENTSSSSSTVTIKPILGYEHGGNLIIPSGYSLVTEEHSLNPKTPYTDFEYILGDENPTITQLKFHNYCNEYDWDNYDEESGNYACLEYNPGITDYIQGNSINLKENDILLTKYIGESSDVIIPDTYVVNEKTYNVILLTVYQTTSLYDDHDDYILDGIFYDNDLIKSVEFSGNVQFMGLSTDDVFSGEEQFYTLNSMLDLFRGCSNLTNVSSIPYGITDMESTLFGCTSLVNAPKIPASVTNMSYTFEGCTSLVNAPVIPEGVTNMPATFEGCTSLVNAPVIPEGVTSMISTFGGCTSLVNAPVIPASVTNMSGTFYGCTSLETAPEIPASVTNMSYTFEGCTSLVNAPVIPASVTNMSGTFSRCTKLTGTIRINSTEISYASYVLNGTELPITVEVPANSTTYTTFSNTKPVLPSNVTIKTF